jgi:hypothetical protein
MHFYIFGYPLLVKKLRQSFRMLAWSVQEWRHPPFSKTLLSC